ncbi:DUF2589 domain-containing protein [Cognaticolwellia aestuarii]|uniref:DUF2589 domain-containing protein n=1 Tax=Cognaticolwellia aestuarii TaxID=329993 RepID=UPI000987A450|nr:DUF2589 domain-containing protein [Cognaticolwellia aestuarii]
MNKKKSKTNKYDFSGMSIDELIAKPLTAIVDAQGKMAAEQVKLLLQNCFFFNGEFYEPKVIKMSITRAVIEDLNSGTQPVLEQIVTYFDLPLISIFPLNSLGIDAVNIHFELEVTAQYQKETDSADTNSNNDHQGFVRKNNSNIEMLGKVSTKAIINQNEAESIATSAAYSVDVVAGPLPLPPGLLSIIDVYTKAIEPTVMPEIEK